jgi:hypothetical protein
MSRALEQAVSALNSDALAVRCPSRRSGPSTGCSVRSRLPYERPFVPTWTPRSSSTVTVVVVTTL